MNRWGARLGDDRLAFPDNHIESDNRLSWLLGRLDRTYGDGAIYVHLRRDDRQTARSFARRYNRGIMRAYRDKIITVHSLTGISPEEVCLDYCDTINANIELFLRDKTRKMNFRMENGRADFERFWDLIGAVGDKASAMAEWNVAHNPTRTKTLLQKVLNAVGIRA